MSTPARGRGIRTPAQGHMGAYAGLAPARVESPCPPPQDRGDPPGHPLGRAGQDEVLLREVLEPQTFPATGQSRGVRRRRTWWPRAVRSGRCPRGPSAAGPSPSRAGRARGHRHLAHWALLAEGPLRKGFTLPRQPLRQGSPPPDRRLRAPVTAGPGHVPTPGDPPWRVVLRGRPPGERRRPGAQGGPPMACQRRGSGRPDPPPARALGTRGAEGVRLLGHAALGE